jgi:hypothetical protein
MTVCPWCVLFVNSDPETHHNEVGMLNKFLR